MIILAVQISHHGRVLDVALLAHPGVGRLGPHLGVVVGQLEVAALGVGLGVRPEVALLAVGLQLQDDYVLQEQSFLR